MDPPVASFELAGAEPVFSEGAGTLTLTVRRVGDSERAATVRYSTAEGSALAGADYESRSGELGFAPFESVKSIAIPVKDDDEAERPEFIDVLLSDATGDAVVGTPRSRIYIADNDSFGISRIDAAGPLTGFLIHGVPGRRYRLEWTPGLPSRIGWGPVSDRFGQEEHLIPTENHSRWIWSDFAREEPNAFFRLVSPPN